ncbi:MULTISPECIES: helix-turn-helix domain-containing protein [Streptosporangium]|uniref:AraC-like DNA-binding protein n=1 Tax=Streptosporangium brasiliense TaxID=47480 RepID=A0ABT9RHL5_9ACTN|nr:AraC family transcriptional regulator [Streptosporangium brasiliense]MDP9868771.1 AraC-like DNA-binding protein [Streptosporangium brasiliense]
MVLVENGQPSEVRQLRYTPGAGSRFGVEVLSFARLRRMDPARLRTRPQRPDFHVLALVRSGTGGHSADFVEHRLRPRDVVWIRPGTVHRWNDVERVDGPLVLFEPGFLPTDPLATASATSGPMSSGPALGWSGANWQLDERSWPAAVRAGQHLAHEHRLAVTAPRPTSAAVLTHLLSVLVLHVRPDQPDTLGAPDTVDQETFARYRIAVEERFATQHQVADYARALGYDRRTLTRATRAATGLGAKQFLDQRIILEAKRLLAHTDLPAARCAQRVGFTDAANFTAFFQRQTGLSPSRWRAERSGR